MEQEISEKFVCNNIELNLIAVAVEPNEWELTIENAAHVRTTWMEFFCSPQAAFVAGRRAIETEGVEEFTNTEGFDYLHQDSRRLPACDLSAQTCPAPLPAQGQTASVSVSRRD